MRFLIGCGSIGMLIIDSFKTHRVGIKAELYRPDRAVAVFGDDELRRVDVLRLRVRALSVTAELRQVQLALAARGARPGYLSAFPEEFFDRVEARKGVWAPYYTLHKILAGLIDVHRVFGDPVALEAAKGMASWVGLRARGLSAAQWQEMLQTEFGGMQESLSELYGVTRDPEHLRLARLFDHKLVFDPLARGEDPLDGLHANTQIPKAIGAARDCALTGDPRGRDVLEPGGARALIRDRRPQ